MTKKWICLLSIFGLQRYDKKSEQKIWLYGYMLTTANSLMLTAYRLLLVVVP